MKFNKDLAAKAGLKSKHIVRLIGVSRYTANNWLSGRRQPHALLQKSVTDMMDSVQDAVNRDRLPVPEDGLLPEECSVKLLQIVQEGMVKVAD